MATEQDHCGENDKRLKREGGNRQRTRESQAHVTSPRLKMESRR